MPYVMAETTGIRGFGYVEAAIMDVVWTAEGKPLVRDTPLVN